MTIKKAEVVLKILGDKLTDNNAQQSACAFAPTNIALCKYWGKRNTELNLPCTSSLSITLNTKGTWTEISHHNEAIDKFYFNNKAIAPDTSFYQRIQQFLNLFRTNAKCCFKIHTHSDIPPAAGLASSASGFAALVLALDKLFAWRLPSNSLSILARLGSGSACRSLWPGFVEWSAGVEKDGMDSHGIPLNMSWRELCIGLLIVSEQAKHISSTKAMQQTVSSSPFYSQWSKKVAEDLIAIKQAIATKDFSWFGKICESNALAMHSLLLSSWPPIHYAQPDTTGYMQRIWHVRDKGLSLYFTQDAGPNLKLLFLENDIDKVLKYFPNLEIIRPFN